MDQIKKEHILAAIKEINEQGVRIGRHSSNYDILFEGKLYPPKLVISIASRFATGTELKPNEFDGGFGTPAFALLQQEGFEIIPKKDPLKVLITNYKSHIQSTQLKDEAYKWDLVQEYNGRPNPDAVDFLLELKSIKFSNLIYAMGYAVIVHLAKDKPNETRAAFKVLFDESKDLADRIQYFNSETLRIYRALGETLQHHQDERSIATYLTYHDSTKYTFYKSSVYKKFCKLLGIKEAKKNEKYVHYLQLIQDFIVDYIESDAELIHQVKQLLPGSYDGEHHMLLAQDILYQMLEKGSEVKYWIFQGNPKIYDVVGALTDNVLSTWTVKAHRNEIKEGDCFILWLTGAAAGCYALGKVASAVSLMEESDAEMRYYLSPTPQVEDYRVKVVIEHNFANTPILWESIKDIPIFSDFKAGTQGTNFSSSSAEFEALLALRAKPKRYWLYAPGEQANKWDVFYEEGIMGLGWDDLGDLKSYKSKADINKKLQALEGTTEDRKNGAIANYEFSTVMSIGDVIIAKKGRTELIGYGVVISDCIFDDNRPTYKNYRKVNWKLKGSWNANHNLAVKTLTDITNFPTEDPKYSMYYERLLATMEDASLNKNDMNDLTLSKTPLNQILYGPPGTGKTYKLQQIIEKWDLKEKISAEKDYALFVKDYTWWKIIALALLELGRVRVPDLANHPLIIAKLGSNNLKSLKTRLWSSLQHHCVDDCDNVKLAKRIGEKVFYKEDNSDWRLDNAAVFKAEYDALVEAYSDFNSGDNTKSKDYTFTTCHQSLSYEDFIEGIKPDLSKADEDEINSSGIVYEIRKGIFYSACEKAAQKAGFINLKDCLDKTKEERKNLFDKALAENGIHVLFLDEINRCNVSAVFGELITLIEEDKRLGRENEIADITLPYSQDVFGVPSNLFVIGTMNTADRSVEALDTALRRRFCFEEMPTRYDLKELEGLVYGFSLKDILATLNKRILRLLNSDHAIGHSYFLNKNEDTIIESFNRNIIPLLQEYFFGDYGKMMLVLGDGFVTYNEWKDEEKFFASYTDAKNDYDVKDLYSIKNYKKEDKTGFAEALKKLMNN